MTSKWINAAALAAMLFLLYCAGLGIRRAVLETQYRAQGADLPFTLESALNYRRIKMIYDTGRLPEVDTFIQYPEGVNVRETYSTGPEYVQAFLAHLFPDLIPVAARIRWIEAGWFCLGIVGMGLWLVWWRQSRWAGFIGAAFYAVALSSVIRSTGQEISRENFALPLLIWHLAFDALAARTPRYGVMAICALLSAIFLGWALASWDLIQFYVLVWVALALVRTVRGPFGDDPQLGLRWALQATAMFVVGLTMPYYRAHGFLLSPPMLLIYGIILVHVLRSIGCWPRTAGRGLQVLLCLLVAFAPPMAGSLAGGSFAESYSHFTELLLAKIRFLNQKPADPSLLTFDQRIMWVPALHSANWGLTITLFPVMLLLGFIAALALIRERRDPAVGQLLIFYSSSLIAFIFFARFHVYLALCASALIGAWAGAGAGRGWRRWAVGIVLVAGLSIEAAHTVRGAEQWGRPNVYYQEMAELARWLQERVAPEPVLANLGVSAYIATYGKCPILLHPKFESAAIRERVKSYGEALFKGDERAFRDWADERGARYYVHALGEFASVGVDQQMRYFVDALEPPDYAAARMFEFRPAEGRYFRLLWKNRKYEVFRILTRDEEAAAARLAHEANQAFERADLDRAEDLAFRTLAMDPANEQAQRIASHVSSLRKQGFGEGGAPGE